MVQHAGGRPLQAARQHRQRWRRLCCSAAVYVAHHQCRRSPFPPLRDDHIIAPVLDRNRSCIDACPQPTDRRSDCWIACVFIGLLGNDTMGTPSIGDDGSAASTGALLLRRFKEAMDNNASICPELTATNQRTDVGTASPIGVETLTLYRLTPPINGSSSTTSFANTNSVDALGLLAVLRGSTAAAADSSGGLARLAVGETLVQASVTVNQLWGELTLCSSIRPQQADNTSSGGSAVSVVSCAPQWNCTCQDHAGSPRSCTGSDHHGDKPCECLIWGGCAGVDNSGVMSVGRRSTQSGHRRRRDADEAAAAATTRGGGGNIYSTMAGGQCDGWRSPCSWKQLDTSSSAGGGPRVASTVCVRDALLRLDDVGAGGGGGGGGGGAVQVHSSSRSNLSKEAAASALVEEIFTGCVVE